MNQIIHPIEPEEVMAYLDGELTADRAIATKAHLGECAECQELVAELRNVSRTLETWNTESPGPEVPPGIAAALSEKQSPRPIVNSVRKPGWRAFFGQRWAIAWAGGFAAILLVVAVSLPNLLRSREHVYHQVGQGDAVDSAVGSASPAPPPPPPSSGPLNGRNVVRLSELKSPEKVSRPPLQDEIAAESAPVASGPLIIRTAQLTLITKQFDQARANLEAILKRHRGYIGELNTGGNSGSGRTLTATLRVPADQLDATLTEVKSLGRVESESQGGQDVTSQYVDLQARLGNARNTEARLTDLLRNRTGKLSDVLAVEQELDRVRGEIEQMEAERKNMAKQVSYATLTATITEDYKAELQFVPPSTLTRLRNAAVEGYRDMVDGILSLALFLLSIGPGLLLWGAILFFPARLAWKKLRGSVAS